MNVDLDDSTELASARRRELDLPHAEARRLGLETMAILRHGAYRAPSGARVEIGALQAHALAHKRSVGEGDPLPAAPARGPACESQVLIANATTAAAAAVHVRAGRRTVALNFANGTTPGGGFLMGARAQEESLCRQSGLYPTLVDDPFYARHLARGDSASSDAAIVSPQVPFLRDDAGTLLEQPWTLDVITCAAPVANRVGRARAVALMRSRIARVLAIAESLGAEALVLGAWGCGAFGNDPVATASDFRTALETRFAGVFAHVAFAITDWSPERRFLGPFRDVFLT